MKKKSVLTLLLAALCVWPALFSCTQEVWEAVPEGEAFEYRFAIAENAPDALPQSQPGLAALPQDQPAQATLPQTQPATRAVLEDGGVFWEAGDRVALFTGNGPAVPANVDVTTRPKTIVFSSSTPLPEGTVIYACYPYTAGTELTAAKISIPAVQQGGSLSAMPMAGVPFRVQSSDSGTQGIINFLNLGAVLDLRIFSAKYAGESIRAVTFKADSGAHPVSGEATLDLSAVSAGNERSLSLNWPGTAPAASSVTLKQGGTVAATLEQATASHRYMVLAPGRYSGSITVTTNAATYTYSFSDKEFSRNSLKRINLNLESSAATREAYYYRIQSADEVHDGDSFLIACENSFPNAHLLHPVLNGNSFRGELVSAPVADKGILSTATVDACQVVLEAVPGSASEFYIKVPGANDSYLYPNNNSLSAGKNASTFTFDGNGGVTIKRENASYFWSTTYYLNCNHSTFSSSSSSSTLALYRKDDGSPRSQQLRFSASSFTFVIDGQPLPIGPVSGIPTLSGALTTVRYTSGDTSVATVDESSGALTIRGAGQTLITASAEADEIYCVGTASYKLTVWAEPTFSLENDAVAAYLDYIETHPYDPADYSYSYVKQFSSATSSANRLDLPKPVPVTWTQPSSGTATVVIYNDAAHTQEERMANVTVTSSTSAEIYSLIPGRKYWYVVKNGGSQIAEGHFSTTGRRRMIKVADCPFGNVYANNCRDFGGLETTSGKVVKFDKIYRGTCMDRVTDAQRNYIMQVMNVGLDVDLRENPESPSNDGSNMYNGLGLDEIQNGDASVYRGHTQERYNSIDKLTDPARMGPTLIRIMNAVENGVGVYVHCKVGADRTGFTCLLLEALLGVKQEQCDIDYELTSFCAAVDDILRERGNKRQTYYYYPRGIELLDKENGATLQEKAINYVVNTLNVPMERITVFQACMLETPVSQSN